MEHKAFVFRYSAFKAELLPLLEEALVTGDPSPLAAFIESERESFRDPYEGEPLDDDWQSLLDIADVHQYGDFALTRYYNPTEDIGLGHAWGEVERLLESRLGGSGAILGRPVGAEGVLFDPGKMGSYFQSNEDVQRNLAEVEQVREPMLNSVVALLRRAVEEGTGIYVTF